MTALTVTALAEARLAEHAARGDAIVRTTPAADLRIATVARSFGGFGGSGWQLTGVASRTGVIYRVVDHLGAYREVIERGAFRDSLDRGDPVVLVVDHRGEQLASTTDGTLHLTETRRGLEVAATLDPAQRLAQRVRDWITRRRVATLSVGMGVTRQEWQGTGPDRLRRITAGTLIDVTVPSDGSAGMNPATSVAVA